MGRTSLRPPERSDAETVDAWLREASGAVLGKPGAHGAGTGDLAAFLAAKPREQEALIVTTRDKPIGLVAWSAIDSGTAAIHFLAIAEPERNLGFGAEAVLGLEARHRRCATLAEVPTSNGLALYFWLRIGYHPIYPGRGSAHAPGNSIWMFRSGNDERAVRSLSSQIPAE
jgi:hypothetical protein